MSAAALTNALAQPQEDLQIVFGDLNTINQLQEILEVAVCNRGEVEVFYHVPRLPSPYMSFMTQPMVACIPYSHSTLPSPEKIT